MKRKSPKNHRRAQRASRHAGPIVFTNGKWTITDTAPAFSFLDDGDTGVYVEGSGDITLVTGGVTHGKT